MVSLNLGFTLFVGQDKQFKDTFLGFKKVFSIFWHFTNQMVKSRK